MKKFILFLSFLLTSSFTISQTTKENKSEIEEMKKTIKELKEKLAAKDTSQFKISIGASFDFNKGVSATDLYYDLSFYDLNIWRTKKKKEGDKKVGLDFKLYQSLLFSNPADTNRISSFTSVRLSEVPPDSVLVGDFSFDRSVELDFTDFGLFIRPNYRLSKSIYLFGHAEFLFRKTVEKISYTSVDTLTIRKVHKSIITKSSLPIDRKTNYRDAFYFLGAGFNVHLDLDPVVFCIKPMVGVSSVIQASRLNRIAGNQVKEGGINYFYLLDI